MKFGAQVEGGLEKTWLIFEKAYYGSLVESVTTQRLLIFALNTVYRESLCKNISNIKNEFKQARWPLLLQLTIFTATSPVRSG